MHDQFFRLDPFREDQESKRADKQNHTQKKIFRKPDDLALSRPQVKVRQQQDSFFADFWRQIGASVLILILGFFVFNFSAYYSLFKNRFENFFGLRENSPLQKLVTFDENNKTGDLLAGIVPASFDDSNQIPFMDLEIIPPDDRIIIPSIMQNIPIVRVSSKNLLARDWSALEKDMQEALRDGVVHYPGTSLPGQRGNSVITGHSSYFPWDPGRFKDVFALLHDVNVGDTIIVYYNQEKFLYEISEKKVVRPEDIDVLKQTPDDRLTLITCTPLGTNLKRLIVVAKPKNMTTPPKSPAPSASQFIEAKPAETS